MDCRPPGRRGAAAAAEADLSPGRAPAMPAQLLDATAKDEYRRRLEDLRGDIEEAEGFNDPERAANARAEYEFISRELAGAVGLGGRDRRASSDAERARGKRHARDPLHAATHGLARRRLRPSARPHDPHGHVLRLRAGSRAADRLAGRDLSSAAPVRAQVRLRASINRRQAREAR